MTTPFLTLLACACILSSILIFVGGELTATGHIGWGFGLLGVGTGWLGILHAAILRIASKESV